MIQYKEMQALISICLYRLHYAKYNLLAISPATNNYFYKLQC